MNLPKLHSIYKSSSGVAIDSRKIKKNSLFFALKGKNFDGNDFAIDAIERGAKYSLVDNVQISKESDKMILVDNVLISLQELANFHRKKLCAKIIAITGSNGKTTTKELIKSVLSQKYITKATVGNLNNEIGVPLTLLEFDENTEFGIVEMGASQIQEINFLTRIIEPDFGLITNFGYAHLEGFGGFEGVIKGKSELYNYLKKKNKLAFLNLDDPIQKKWISKLSSFTYGRSRNSDCKLKPIENIDKPLELKLEKEIINTQLYGNYNFSNIACAIAIGRFFKLNLLNIKKGIYEYIPRNNRSQIILRGSNSINLDAYNANPTSMSASISSFNDRKKRMSIVILGDMLELGIFTSSAHQKIIDQLEESKIEEILTVGNLFFNTETSHERFKKFRNVVDLKKYIKKKNFINSDILIKGSRKMQLEKLINLF